MNESIPTPPPLPEPADADPLAAAPTPKKKRRRRLLIRAGVLLLGATAFWLILLHATLLVLLDRKTPDYVMVGADKIYLLERTLYHQDLDQEVVLLGMAHVGDASFYEAVDERLGDDGLILWEGVTDEQGLLGGGTAKPYGNVSDVFGLSQQGRFDQPDHKMIWADVDAAVLKPESLRVLRLMLGMMGNLDNRDAFRESIREFSRLEAENPGVEKRLMADLIDTRNERLLTVIAEHHDADRLFVPWGAWHMPGVEDALQDRGFVITAERKREVTAMTRVYGGAFRALLRGIRTRSQGGQ